MFFWNPCLGKGMWFITFLCDPFVRQCGSRGGMKLCCHERQPMFLTWISQPRKSHFDHLHLICVGGKYFYMEVVFLKNEYNAVKTWLVPEYCLVFRHVLKGWCLVHWNPFSIPLLFHLKMLSITVLVQLHNSIRIVLQIHTEKAIEFRDKISCYISIFHKTVSISFN